MNGRNYIDWDMRLELDIRYVENITFIGDVKIVFQTVLKFLKKQDIAVNTNSVEPNFAEERSLKLQLK